jgi:hypothetical protein
MPDDEMNVSTVGKSKRAILQYNKRRVAQQVVSGEMMIFFLFSLKWVYVNMNYEMPYIEH